MIFLFEKRLLIQNLNFWTIFTKSDHCARGAGPRDQVTQKMKNA